MPVDPREIESRVVEAVPDPMSFVRARDIGPLVGMTTSWFTKHYKELAAEGFPPAFVKGRWWKRDVVRFLLLRGQPRAVRSEIASDAVALADILTRTDEYFARRRPKAPPHPSPVVRHVHVPPRAANRK